MSNRRVLLTVVITLVVIAIVVAGGFAVYRLGYVRGAAESFAGPMMRGFAGQFGDERSMPFHEFNGRGDLYQRMPMVGFTHAGLRGQPVFGGLTGLLLIIGVGALVVIAINGLRDKGAQDTTIASETATEAKPKRRSG